MNWKFALAIGATALLSQAGPASAANLLINGDFENGPPSITPGGVGNDYYRGTPNGWTRLNDDVDIIGPTYDQPFPIPRLLPAQSGSYFLDMNGQGTNGSLYQDVTGLTAGTEVQLTLWTGQWVTNSRNSFITFSLRDAANPGVALATNTVDVGGQPWTQQMLTAFAPSSGAIRVQLEGTTDFQAGGGLDNVSLTSATVAVPEPSTWAMMIIGFGAAGSMIRRRKAVVA